jgi:hypothetical protein
MKYILITLAFTLNLIAVSFAQTGNKAGVSFDGIYIVKSGEVPAAKIEIYTYLRFYKDGTVCLQAVSSYDPKSVAAWFGRYKKYSQKGTFQVSGTNITIELDNKESEDIKL